MEVTQHSSKTLEIPMWKKVFLVALIVFLLATNLVLLYHTDWTNARHIMGLLMALMASVVSFVMFAYIVLNKEIRSKRNNLIVSDMGFDREEAQQELDNGTDPLKVAFRLGFQACLESVQDKGYPELVEKLKFEHSELKNV